MEGKDLLSVSDIGKEGIKSLIANAINMKTIGINFRIASPRSYEVNKDILCQAQAYMLDSGSEIVCTDQPRQAVSDDDIIYTDVWTSMGQEDEADERSKVFSGYQVNDEMVSLAKKGVIIMHPLQAHRGEEVSENIIDSAVSVAFEQAENRLHIQKALLAMMLGERDTFFTNSC